MSSWTSVEVIDWRTTPLGRAEQESWQASGVLASGMVAMTDREGTWTQPVELVRRDGDLLVLMCGRRADPLVQRQVLGELVQSTRRLAQGVGGSIIADEARRLARDLEALAPTRDIQEAKALYEAAARAKVMALYAERYEPEMACAVGEDHVRKMERAYADLGR